MLTTITKETKHMGALTFKEIPKNTAKEMIVENHYSHKWNNAFGLVNIGVIRDGEILGVAVFGNMMNPKSYKKIANIEENEIIELNRLWISDELGHNAESIMLGACWKILKADYPHIKLVQSFADGRLGCGTIYKATNFKYYGKTKTMFYHNKVTGETVHNAVCNNTARPKGMVEHNNELLKGNIEFMTVYTYRYIYPLTKNVEIYLKEQPYPTYDKGYEISEAVISDNLLAKMYLFNRALGNFKLAGEAIALMKTDNLHKVLNEAQNNEYVKKYLKRIEEGRA